MAITFRTSTNGSIDGSTTTVTRPSGTTDGDLLVTVLSRNGLDTPNSSPTGWTQAEGATGPNGTLIYVYWKIASSEPASWDWGWSSNNAGKAWMCARFDGTHAVSPIGDSNIANAGNTANPSWANGITPPVANSVLLLAVEAVQNSTLSVTGVGVTTSDPGGWTSIISSSIGAATPFMLFMSNPRSQVTATGNSTATLGASTADSIACLLSISPAESTGNAMFLGANF